MGVVAAGGRDDRHRVPVLPRCGEHRRALLPALAAGGGQFDHRHLAGGPTDPTSRHGHQGAVHGVHRLQHEGGGHGVAFRADRRVRTSRRRLHGTSSGLQFITSWEACCGATWLADRFRQATNDADPSAIPGRKVRARQISTAASASAAVALPALTSSAVSTPSTVPRPPGEMGMNVPSRLTPNAKSAVAKLVDVAASRCTAAKCHLEHGELRELDADLGDADLGPSGRQQLVGRFAERHQCVTPLHRAVTLDHPQDSVGDAFGTLAEAARHLTAADQCPQEEPDDREPGDAADDRQPPGRGVVAGADEEADADERHEQRGEDVPQCGHPRCGGRSGSLDAFVAEHRVLRRKDERALRRGSRC